MRGRKSQQCPAAHYAAIFLRDVIGEKFNCSYQFIRCVNPCLGAVPLREFYIAFFYFKITPKFKMDYSH